MADILKGTPVKDAVAAGQTKTSENLGTIPGEVAESGRERGAEARVSLASAPPLPRVGRVQASREVAQWPRSPRQSLPRYPVVAFKSASSTRSARIWVSAWLFFAPTAILLFALVGWPFVQGVYISFHQYHRVESVDRSVCRLEELRRSPD